MYHVIVRAALLAAIVTTSATESAATPTVEFRVGPSVIGSVRDSAGTPLPNVQVVVAEAGRSATTDAAGRFVIRGLARGEYHLTMVLIGYRPGHAIVTVPDTGADITISIVMTASPLRLQAVSVTASPTGTDPERVAQATVEVSGLALQRALASSIAQTLGQEPGVSVRFDGPATMPVIRGLTGDRILVLQDGARTADLSSASADHASTVDPLAASRIEVVRGPASLLYGNNALGGVVNVISNDIPTSVPTHLEGYFGAIGSTGAPGGATTLSLTNRLSDAWALNLRGGLQSASPIRVGGGGELGNTQARNVTGNAALGYVGQRATVGGSVSNYTFNYGLPHPPGDDEEIHIAGNRLSAAIRATVNTRSRAIPLVKVDAGAQDYHHDELSAEGEVGTAFKLKTQTLNASAKTHVGRVRGSVGAQLLGKQYAATGDEALTPAANSTGFGAFFYQELPLRGDGASELVPMLSFGGRFDVYEIASKSGDPKFGAARTVDVSSPSGSIGLSMPLGALATLSANAALAFRAPTVEELFSNGVHEASGSYDLGNASLRAEQSRGFEAVLRVGTGTVSGSASAYVNNISNYVFPDVTRDTIVDGEDMPLAIYAQGDARLSGFEGSVEVRATQRLVLGAMGDYVKGSFSDDGTALPFMPPARVGGSARWDDGRRNIGVELRHGFEQDRSTGGSDIPTASYTLLNASAGINIIAGGRVHSITLRVDNVGDTKYFDATSRIKEFAPNPGRNMALVYKVLF